MDDETSEQLEQSGAGDYGGAPTEEAEESGRTATEEAEESGRTATPEDAPPEGGDGSEG